MNNVSCENSNSLQFYVMNNIQNNTFNCNNLPICSLTCSGPNINILHTVTHQCSCMIEWEFHSIILQYLIGFIVYILLNISR